jgi:tryptophan halogenase
MKRGVVIIGGGTAGYLSALTLRAFHPDLDVTIIDSAAIPIIGVGEATTSEIIPFLHTVLNFDPGEFYEKVLPTWKLGIKFLWGNPGANSFNYPFDRGLLYESVLYDGDNRNATLNSALMSADLTPVLALNDPPLSLLSKTPFSYHLDNGRFVRYLR